MSWIIGGIIYIMIGIIVFLISIKDDHSDSWTMFPIIVPIVVLGYPFLLIKKLFEVEDKGYYKK
ncbi:hypothetical protein [Priestia flexa]|uniref:hypothetical protein n=1 Tax=Priestia flexa TaxID=86664 RepID=UPI0004739053|nr:hypothetical protein [Priestia flexa]